MNTAKHRGSATYVDRAVRKEPSLDRAVCAGHRNAAVRVNVAGDDPARDIHLARGVDVP